MEMSKGPRIAHQVDAFSGQQVRRMTLDLTGFRARSFQRYGIYFHLQCQADCPWPDRPTDFGQGVSAVLPIKVKEATVQTLSTHSDTE